MGREIAMNDLTKVATEAEISSKIIDGLCRLFPGITRKSFARGERKADEEFF